WDQWVGGSNPLSPTNFEPRFGGVFCFPRLQKRSYLPDIAKNISLISMRFIVQNSPNSLCG
ncbi:MAG: hypothetical protein E6054_26880, partial [Klebsiella michiganensis]|nr:hypothetical protein [Klebsiella michiganensis]